MFYHVLFPLKMIQFPLKSAHVVVTANVTV